MSKVVVPDKVGFFPIEGETSGSLKPQHMTYACGACGKSTNGRVLCRGGRGGDSVTTMHICLCSCEQREPSILFERDGAIIQQLPNGCEFHSSDKWPPELAKLYDEAAKAYAAGAFTAASMVCRKLLMNCACHEGAEEDLKFFKYVDYIVDKVLMIPRAKDSITAIKDIGNEANHEIQFVTQDGAKRSMQIATYLLNAIYSLPAA